MLYCSIISKKGETVKLAGFDWSIIKPRSNIGNSGNIYLDRSIRGLDLFKSFSSSIDTFHAMDHAISDCVVHPPSTSTRVDIKV